MSVASWTRVYWPIALVLSLLAFFIPYLFGVGSVGIGLLVGVALLGGVELACALTGHWGDTFSVWVWDSVGVTKSTPMRDWNAKHYLTLVGYLVIVVALNQWPLTRSLSRLNVIEDVVSLGGSLWLLRHFFWHWWT